MKTEFSSVSPRVDVIIPAYNSMPHLLEAIDSVLGQSHQNLCVLVVDDGSTDNTVQAMAHVKDERVVFVRKENGGPSSARNVGFEHSTAPFITYLDADDVWEPDKVAEQLALFTANDKLGLVYGHQICIDEVGQVTGELQATRRGQIFDDLLTGNIVTGSASMVMVPRWVLEEVGGWREDIRIGEDWELWMRICHRYEADFVPKPLARIRMLASGAQQNFLKVASDHERLLPIILSEFKLSGRQRRLAISGHCWIAAVHYYMAGRPKLARQLMLKFLLAKPSYLFDYHHWAMYARIYIHPKILRWIFGTKEYPSAFRILLQNVKKIVKRRVTV